MLSNDVTTDSRLSTLAFIGIPVWVFDVDIWQIVWANEPGLSYWGVQDESELYARDFIEGMPDTIKSRLQQIQQECHGLQQTVTGHWPLFPEGIPRTAELALSPFVLKNSHKALLVQVVVEIDSASAETLNRTTAMMHTNAIMHTSTMISIYDIDYKLLYCNPAARDSLLPDCSTLTDRLVNSGDMHLIRNALATTDHCDVELEVNTTLGRQWHTMNIKLSTNDGTGDQLVLISATDASEHRQAQREAYQLAYTDSLTGLPNRAALGVYLDEIHDSDEFDSAEFGLFFLDLDRFKIINDSLGHAIGDQLLVEVALRLKQALGENGLVCRLGGDEFVMIANRVTELDSLRDVALEILRVMEEPFLLANTKLRVLPSIGISRYPIDGDSMGLLMQNADTAMYLAKSNQCGYRFFDKQMSVAINQTVKNRLDLENDLATAVENQEFELHYQPKVLASDLSVAGVEALIRWNHPTRGMVQPDEFISIAEETRQIIELGNWVLDTALRQQCRWHSMGISIPVSVNISAKQFNADDLLMSVSEALTNTRCDPAMVELEITESMLLGDANKVHETLQQLSAMGVRLALDDFGTGYSNLAYLQNYPLDTLKIDKVFLAGQKHSMLMGTILSMGKVLGLSVVAEGVETAAQVDWLIAHGCDELQGYYFSKPLPVEAATQFLKDNGAQKSSDQKAA